MSKKDDDENDFDWLSVPEGQTIRATLRAHIEAAQESHQELEKQTSEFLGKYLYILSENTSEAVVPADLVIDIKKLKNLYEEHDSLYKTLKEDPELFMALPLLKQSLDHKTQMIDAQGRRIEKLESKTNWFFALLITLIIAFLGIAGALIRNP